MERAYREFFEATSLKKQDYTEEVENYYNNLITVRKGVRKNNDKQDSLVFTTEIFQSTFGKKEMQERLSDILAGALIEALKKNKYKLGKKVLAVGLGNEKMTADSLGSKTVDGLQISRHFINSGVKDQKMANISAIKSSVNGVTGLDSFDIIKGVISTTKPDFVIAIDTLASKSLTRLAKAIQITDYGIEPGGGVNNQKTILDINTLGVPVIAVGVPFVIYVINIIREYLAVNNAQIKDLSSLSSYVVCAKDIDIAVEEFSYILSKAINIALNTA